MQVVDRAALDDTGAVDKYCTTSTGGPLRVTLAWADCPPAHAAGPQLVNDLDLEVRMLGVVAAGRLASQNCSQEGA